MKSNSEKSAGLSLMIGSFLMIVTMVLHPVGGDFHHMVRIVNIGTISHAIGLLSIPFALYGYWGIMAKMEEEIFLSRVAFSFISLGLVAIMIAATLNGLVLTQLVRNYAGASDEVISDLTPIFRLIHAFNLANDYIYIAAVGISTLFWSIAMLRVKKFPAWLAYLGIVLVLAMVISALTGFVFTDVAGFRAFIIGTTAWTIAAGWWL